MAKDLLPVIEHVKAILADAKENINDNGGLDKGDFKDVVAMIKAIAAEVNKVSKDMGELSEKEKKEVVARTLNELVDIPWVPEVLEGKIFGFAVDLTWDSIQEKLGK